MLLTSRNALKERILQKREAILAWLKGESYSTVPILSQVLGTQGNACWKTLKAMERDGFVQAHQMSNHFGKLTIWGITPHGSAMAADPEDDNPDFSHFEPGRLSPHTISHSLDVQQARLQLEALGWTQWRTDRQSRQMQMDKIPDGIATNSEGKKVAIELERTIKTIKRYEVIIAAYLEAINAGKLDQVLYISPVPGLAKRLERIFMSIDAVHMNGERIKLEPLHYAKFGFKEITQI